MESSAAQHISPEAENSGVEKQKASSAFRTIGEVAAELGLPPHVLRFWESKFPQIKPHKRRGGHRYYRPVDIDTLKEIKALLYERGYTIKGAQKHLKDKKQGSNTQGAMFEEPAAPKPVSLSALQQDFGRKDTNRLKKILNGLEEVREMLVAK